ncbi:MAG TPA: hypothetical protein PLP27_01455 [Crocinitomicaceae bacterium]|jgi:succinate dehydrogenase/fumarate reductase cytochrome b subunit|nr:hypothetical protein [Crocinitomicaceae bacterium]
MWFNNKVQSFENTRFGSMSWMIIVQSCIGGLVGAMELAAENYFLLALTATLAMASNTAFIAQVAGKYCLGIFYASVLFNGLVGLYYLFV